MKKLMSGVVVFCFVLGVSANLLAQQTSSAAEVVSVPQLTGISAEIGDFVAPMKENFRQGTGCTNLALGRPAIASSSKGTNTPNLAVDGNIGTFWRSNTGGTQYVRVDLGAGAHSYSQATVRWQGVRFAKSFKVVVSNVANFSTYTIVFSTTTGAGGDQTVSLSGAPRTERYALLHMTVPNNAYYAVNEFEVCGDFLKETGKETAGGEFETLPSAIALHPNYPNPFSPLGRGTFGNPTTNIRFSLPQEAQVSLKIYNLIGCEVATLVDERRRAGTHTVTFNAANLPGGVYFAVLKVGEVKQTRRLILLK